MCLVKFFFFAGHVPTENLRFRTEELVSKMTEIAGDEEEVTQDRLHEHPTVTKTLWKFMLEISRKGSASCM